MIGTAYTALVSSQFGSNENLGIWIDFDDDCIFEPSERVAVRILNSTLNTPVTVTIPTLVGGGTVGVHRMRVTLLYNVVANPCGPPATFGETHDYSVNIIASASEYSHLISAIMYFLLKIERDV